MMATWICYYLGWGVDVDYRVKSRGPNSFQGKPNLCISGIQIQVFGFTSERIWTPALGQPNGGRDVGVLF